MKYLNCLPEPRENSLEKFLGLHNRAMFSPGLEGQMKSSIFSDTDFYLTFELAQPKYTTFVINHIWL